MSKLHRENVRKRKGTLDMYMPGIVPLIQPESLYTVTEEKEKIVSNRNNGDAFQYFKVNGKLLIVGLPALM